MADLAKYEEVVRFTSLFHPAEGAVNEQLAAGWELIAVKTVEVQFRCNASGGNPAYIQKDSQTVYVLGKLRNKAKAKTP